MSLDPMNSDPQKGGMHPEDKRNMLLFVVLSLAIWFAFDHFVIKPKEAQILASRAVSSPTLSATKTPAPVAEEKLLDRATVLQTDQRISIKNTELSGSFALKGNRIDDLSLNTYFEKIDKKDHVVLMSPSGTKAAHYAEIGWLAEDEAINLPGRETVWTVEGNNRILAPGTPVTLRWDNGADLVFERILEVDENYLFTITQKVTNASKTKVTLYPYGALARRGIPEGHGKGVGYEGPQGYIADEMHEIAYSKFEDKPEVTFQGTRGWIGFGEKYWLSSLLPPQIGEHSFRFGALRTPSAGNSQTLYQVDVRGEGIEIAPGTTAETKMDLFVGVKKIDLLDAYEQKTGVKHFDLAVDFGVLYFLTRPLYFLLILFNGWVHNFGIAILMLTLMVRLLVFPLASASYRSFAKLRKVGPQMAELKIRYGNDKPRMQQELIKLYETERVNPMAGCFPLLLQIPVFFAVYKVFSIAVEMRHAPFFGWIHDLSAMDSLSVFNAFGLLPYDVPKFLHIGPWSLVMLAMMLIQKKLNPPPQDQIQRDIANYMPWIVTYTLSSFPVGLVIYWAFSNTFSVLQQMAIMRSMGVPVYLFSPDAALEHHSSHERALEEAKERAKKDHESGAKSEPVVVEALFDEAPQKDTSHK